jgi:hypothetical protein
LPDLVVDRRSEYDVSTNVQITIESVGTRGSFAQGGRRTMTPSTIPYFSVSV